MVTRPARRRARHRHGRLRPGAARRCRGGRDRRGAHAGWRGAVAGVLEATVAAMVRLGAEPARIAAAIGPCIGQASTRSAPICATRCWRHHPPTPRFLPPARGRATGSSISPATAPRGCAVRARQRSRIVADTAAEPERFFSHRRRTLAGGGPIGHQISVMTCARHDRSCDRLSCRRRVAADSRRLRRLAAARSAAIPAPPRRRLAQPPPARCRSRRRPMRCCRMPGRPGLRRRTWRPRCRTGGAGCRQPAAAGRLAAGHHRRAATATRVVPGYTVLNPAGKPQGTVAGAAGAGRCLGRRPTRRRCSRRRPPPAPAHRRTC